MPKKKPIRASTFRKAARLLNAAGGCCYWLGTIGSLSGTVLRAGANSKEHKLFRKMHRPRRALMYWWPSFGDHGVSKHAHVYPRRVALLETALNLEHQGFDEGERSKRK